MTPKNGITIGSSRKTGLQSSNYQCEGSNILSYFEGFSYKEYKDRYSTSLFHSEIVSNRCKNSCVGRLMLVFHIMNNTTFINHCFRHFISISTLESIWHEKENGKQILSGQL